MNTSDFGITLIRRMEGLRLIPYKDTNGYYTCGFGHKMNREPTPGEAWTTEQACQQFAQDLIPAEAAVNRAITVPMTQPQFDACVSLAFNIGGHAFESSTLVRDFNAGKYIFAANAFTLWNDRGRAMERRLEERAVFRYGSPI